jgi:hypothetical protein
LCGLRVYVFGRVTDLDVATGSSGFLFPRLKNTTLQDRTNRKGITRKAKICVSVIPMNRMVLWVEGITLNTLVP